jgi:nitrate reductase gamma subunit
MQFMDLLEFARGPALAVAVAVFILGLAWRLYGIFRRPSPPDYSAPRRADTAAGALRAVLAKMLPPRGVKIRGAQMINAYGYHIALALVVFTFAPHIVFVQRHTGLHWPALPDPVTYIATGIAIIGLLVALMNRLTDGVLRLLSNFDDYFSWALTLLPLVTGMALPPAPAQPTYVAIHLLSVELLLVWLPFGKLAHAALVFVSRWRTGAAFTRKGAAV